MSIAPRSAAGWLGVVAALAALLPSTADGPPPSPVSAEHHARKLIAADWPTEPTAVRERLAWFVPGDPTRDARIAEAIAGLGASAYAERERATAALAAMGPGVRAALDAAAASPDQEVRARIAALIAWAERDAPIAVEATLYLAHDPDPHSRDAVVSMVAHGPAVLRAIATTGPLIAKAAGAPPDRVWLRSLLAHPVPVVRAAGVSALGALPAPSDLDHRTFAALLADPQPEVRLAAASSADPRHAAAAAQVLLELVADADRERAARAADAFGRLADLSLPYSHLPAAARDGTWARRFALAVAGGEPDPPALLRRWETTLVLDQPTCVAAAFERSGEWAATWHRSAAIRDRIELLRLTHLARGTVVLERPARHGEGLPRCLALGSGARHLYLGLDSGPIGVMSPWRMWIDPQSGGGYYYLAANRGAPIVALRVNDGDSALLALEENGGLQLWRKDASRRFRLMPLAEGLGVSGDVSAPTRWWAIAFDASDRPIGVRYHPRGWLEVIDVESGTPRLALEADLGKTPMLALARDASRVAWIMREGAIVTWDLRTGRRSLIPTTLSARALALPVASSDVVIGARAGEVEVWDASARMQRARWVLRHHGLAWFDLDATGTRLVANRYADYEAAGGIPAWPNPSAPVVVADVTTGGAVGAPAGPHAGTAQRVTWIDGGRRLATADQSGRLAIWEVDVPSRTVRLARTHSPPPQTRCGEDPVLWVVGPVERADGRVAVATRRWVHVYDPSGRRADESIAVASGGTRCTPVALPEGSFAIAWDGTAMGRVSLADARWTALPANPDAVVRPFSPYSPNGRLRFSLNAAHEWVVCDLSDESGATRVTSPGVDLIYGAADGSPVHAWAPDARVLVLGRHSADTI